MAKGIGLIGNFKGKVGNTVGYKLSASNTGNTQGIRIYQPIVKNPKTSAQAEQRAKLAPINATYRALKMVIDRGNEGLPYGNKSRLAWLKKAFMAANMPWYEKGASIAIPVPCELTKGSLAGVQYTNDNGSLTILCEGASSESAVATVGNLSTLLLAAYPTLKAGDQVTIVIVENVNNIMSPTVVSFIIDTTSAEAQNVLEAGAGKLIIDNDGDDFSYAVIVSREGANGEHLRSNASLLASANMLEDAPFNEASKKAAIASYKSSTSANADWAEESIQ